MAIPKVDEDRDDQAEHDDHPPHGVVSVMGRVLLVFLMAAIWCFVLAIAYAYGGGTAGSAGSGCPRAWHRFSDSISKSSISAHWQPCSWPS